jgi:seryl-tRNA(Sec) selenium transferase
VQSQKQLQSQLEQQIVTQQTNSEHRRNIHGQEVKDASTSMAEIAQAPAGAVDIRSSNFTNEAMRMNTYELKTLLMRDDIVCEGEKDVLVLVLTYIKTKVQEFYDQLRRELLPCVRFD